jgi:ATP-dependent protease ClpP protease subunit
LPVPNKDFRENCDRAIYVTGRIDQELLTRLTPEINRFRLKSLDPVTVYIDSMGGSTFYAEHIRQLIRAPHPDGGRCRIITVVTGTAASAAADMLAQGDYAIAFPHSYILYHGFRTSSDSALTYEGASSLASSLQESNERSAVKMARCAFPRFCFRVSQFKDEIQQYIEQAAGTNTAPLEHLLGSLEKKISPANIVLVRDAAQKQVLIKNLTQSVTKHLGTRKVEKLSYAEFEAELLKAIVNHKTKSHKAEPWSLSSEGLAEVSNDFKLLHDFHFGSQKRDLERFLRTLGKLFLRDTERQEFEAMQADEAAKLDWLKTRVESRLHPLWYFVVSISRLLQTADYSLQPDEAYWLGLIDEVRGSGLPNIREGVESLPVEESPSPAVQV